MPLRDKIADLLRMPENGAGAPSLDAIETTLTDGYAEALALEAERWRLERRLGEVARDAGEVSAHNVAEELSELSERLETADGELAGLRSLLRNLQARRRSAPALPFLDDPAAHRVDGRLDAVVDLQLHQDVRDVVLDGLRADVELGGDHGVVLAVRDQLQHLDLALGELRADHLLDLGLRTRGADPLQHLRGDVGRDERFAARGGPDPRDELLDRGVLEEIAAGPGEDRVGDVVSSSEIVSITTRVSGETSAM